MTNIHETIRQVEKLSPELGRQIKKYVRDHSYGLVFEQDLPESVRLYTKTPAINDTVNILPPRGQKEKDENWAPWVVKNIKDTTATIDNGKKTETISVNDIVPIVSYKDTIYPGLKEVDRIERGNPNDSYQVVINAENYHALEMLTYCYPSKVDCIYIDPPYNTGAQDWKYNNNYVDATDKYRHSKWLSFMERRLKLAKQLLNPNNSVLICTVDEHEYLRLGLLLEQVFPEARIQMISSVINPTGAVRVQQFNRTDEYIFILEFGSAVPLPLPLSSEWRTAQSRISGPTWRTVRRRGSHDARTDRFHEFYPIYCDRKSGKIIKVGLPLAPTQNRSTIKSDNSQVEIVFPLRSDGSEGCWQISRNLFISLLHQGFIRTVSRNKFGWVPTYLAQGERTKIKEGVYKVTGRSGTNNEIHLESEGTASFVPGTQWRISSHNAGVYGSTLIKSIFHDSRFNYPKSLYAVHDVIRFFVDNNPNALIVDFFAGSGTTLQAVNLLNAEDGGHRHCVLVTNNEVSADESSRMAKKGLRPGDPDWEKYGIARYVTWPRTKCTIKGVDINGKPLKGTYLGTNIPMSDGFKANAIFFDLTYQSLWPVRLDRAFSAIAPILWMQAGCRGPIIIERNKSYKTTPYYGVLFDYNQASKFCQKVKATPTITDAYVVTDDQRRYSAMCRRLPGINVHRLYESYLRTFQILGEGALD